MVLFDQLVVEGVQTRLDINKGVVKSYAKLMKDGVEFPPIVVLRGLDENDFLVDVLVDGYTRVQAMKANGMISTIAEIRDVKTCSVQEVPSKSNLLETAILMNIRLNSKSGYAMTTADKKNAVLKLLAMFPSWSDRAVGTECGVDHKTVGKYRKAIAEELHREMTGEPKSTIEEKEKAPTAKELRELIEKLKLDLVAIEERWMYSEAEVGRLTREGEDKATYIIELEKKVVGGFKEPKLSNNAVKRLMKLLHPDNFLDIEKSNPDWYDKINEAMKLITGANNSAK